MQSKKEENKEKEDLKPDKINEKPSFDFAIKSIKILSQVTTFDNDQNIQFYKILCKENKSGFWVFNPEEDFIIFSDDLIELLNLPSNEQAIIETFQNQFVNADEAAIFYSGLNYFLKNKSHAEFKIKVKDSKNSRIFHNSLSSLILKDKTELVVGIARDITKQVQYEEELAKQKEKAIESDRIKSAFLKNISHEIRTPMNSVIGFIELLDNQSFEEEKKKEFLNIIKSKSKQLLSLIDDIAELSKFESGEIGINRTETNLARIFQELHKEYSEKATNLKNNLEIFLNLPAGLHEHQAYTDPGRVQQILSYFLDNALKYTDKGYIQLGYEIKDNKQVTLYVKDTGVGIPKEAQKYLFNRFRISEDTIDPKMVNTGLGLTISRAIVEQLGGKISVESAPGQGSVFSFTIPYVKLEKNIASKITEEQNIKPNWRNKVIIVAEDDEVNFHFLEAVLADTQVRLIHVHNGKQAIEICQTLGNIDLILMDIRMPEKSGHEAVKEIKKIRKDIPIIAQTAYTGKEERDKCLQAGCDDYISKPIDISLLINKINYFLAD